MSHVFDLINISSDEEEEQEAYPLAEDYNVTAIYDMNGKEVGRIENEPLQQNTIWKLYVEASLENSMLRKDNEALMAQNQTASSHLNALEDRLYQHVLDLDKKTFRIKFLMKYITVLQKRLLLNKKKSKKQIV